MTRGHRVEIEEMDRDAAITFIERNHVGRIAFTFHDRVDIEPISYVYSDGWLYARTSPGTKLTAVQHHPWVAFEVDEIKSRSDWRSVVVRGTIYFLDQDRGAHERADYDRAIEVLRTGDPDVLTADDTAPHRQTLFRIHADEITGRTASR